MDSFSDSVQKITSQTKNANLAFMNFGRIIQDAPFGLIGIANNIDPMLVSFSNLSNEIDVTTGKMRGFGGAMSQLGKQLLGPAGLIFILGSLIPSALLLIQSRQRDAAKESDHLAEAIKRVADEFGRLAGQAASKRGIAQVNTELETTSQTIDAINNKQKALIRSLELQASIESRSLLGTKEYDSVKKAIFDRLKKENSVALEQLDIAKQALESNKQNLETEQSSIKTREVIAELQREEGIAATLSIQQQIEKSRELNDLRIRGLEHRDPIAAEIAREQERIMGDMAKMATNAEFMASEQGKKTYNGLRDRLATIADEIRAKHQETTKENIEDADDYFERLQRYQLDYTRYVNSELENRLLSARLNFEEIYNSEFATDEQRLKSKRVYHRLEQEIFDEFRQKAKDKDEKDRQEKLKKDLDAVREFVRRQQDILNRSADQIQARYDLQLMAAQLSGNQEIALEIEKLQQLRDLRRTYQELGLLDTEEYKRAEAAIIANTENQKKQFAIDTLNEIFNATVAVGNLIFGETKALATAQVVVDTLFGIQRILADGKMNPIAIAKAATLAANGAITIRKINATQKGASSVSDDNQRPVFVTSQDTYEIGDSRLGRRTSPFISTNMANSTASMLTNPMMGNGERISITANVDRRGLAIAVRDGERAIRSQQFDYK
jgi:hypothetical protein